MDMKLIGINACKMAFEKRPNDIAKIYLTEENIKSFAHILKVCSAKKKPYKLVTDEELEKVTASTHHEGVCFVVERKKIYSAEHFLTHTKQTRMCIVALENVDNPHNVGALLRVCANFGVTAVLMRKASTFQNAAVFRTSEGGAEWVDLIDCESILTSIDAFKKKGFKVYTSSSHIGRQPHRVEFPDKTLFVFGSEKTGLTNELLKKGDAILCISGTGHVESLNVASAASIILNAHYVKQNHAAA